MGNGTRCGIRGDRHRPRVQPRCGRRCVVPELHHQLQCARRISCVALRVPPALGGFADRTGPRASFPAPPRRRASGTDGMAMAQILRRQIMQTPHRSAISRLPACTLVLACLGVGYPGAATAVPKFDTVSKGKLTTKVAGSGFTPGKEVKIEVTDPVSG